MTTFDYDDVNLIPKKCIISSRSECNTAVSINNFIFKLPIVPANMECVINQELAIKLAENKYFYIMHRFNIDIVEFVKKMKSLCLLSSISVGVNKDSYDILEKLKEKNLTPDFITVDIAHGHSVLLEKMVIYIKNNFSTFVIGGNVCTVEATDDLIKWGVDAVKVGIGPGSACTTYYNTGFGSRGIQLSCVKECAQRCKSNNIICIADGGITHLCGIAKSLVVGADLVMIGGMMTGFLESPGRVVENGGKLFQEFYGSASEHSSSSKNKNIEGTIKLIPYKNKSIFKYLQEIEHALQSSISYGGGKILSDLQKVKYVVK